MPGELNVWTGWPMFDTCFCQFELNQWMHAFGAIPHDISGEPDSEEFERRKRGAIKTLPKIANYFGTFDHT